MYAVIEHGSHQFKVQEGDTFEVQRRDLADGQTTWEFDRVMMIGDGENSRVGRPYLEGAKVVARINGELKGAKIDVYKFRRRKNYRRKTGHRQRYLRVTVERIEAPQEMANEAARGMANEE